MIRADEHVVFVGMMGVGKTTIARVVADRLGRRVFDSDAVIESRYGRTVREIFAADGEAALARGADASRYPRLVAYKARMQARPAYQRAVAKGGPVVMASP